MIIDDSAQEVGADYIAFTEKFKPKKTTDDCYTPDIIYDAVQDWACREYGIDPEKIVRPFYPGGDYQNFTYDDGAVVVDNPPFSILAEIRRFYIAHGIKYFLFCPTLTVLSAGLIDCVLACDCRITYANGAVVNTSFCTNLEPETVIRSAPELLEAVNAADVINKATRTASLPKYEYPDHVIMANDIKKLSYAGINFKVPRTDASFVRVLDDQKPHHKTLFGGGMLVSDRMAKMKRDALQRAERVMVERMLAAREKNGYVWKISPRERSIIEALGE